MKVRLPGIDDLSGIFLIADASLLATPITQLCNLSISSGRFPDACKIDHNILLLKMPSLGFSREVIGWYTYPV